MATEILNINFHRRRLLLLALNKQATRQDQAQVLGIAEKTLFNMIKEFDVVKVNGVYVSNVKIMVAAEV